MAGKPENLQNGDVTAKAAVPAAEATGASAAESEGERAKAQAPREGEGEKAEGLQLKAGGASEASLPHGTAPRGQDAGNAEQVLEDVRLAHQT